MSRLECDRPARHLTGPEKEQILREWRDTVGSTTVTTEPDGRPDPDMVPWCERVNRLPGVCTVQSCAGHGSSDREGASVERPGHLWLRLTREVAAAFDRRAFALAALEGIERVERIYQPWGEEVTSVTFAGNERNSLSQSMGTILRFFATLAEEAHGEH